MKKLPFSLKKLGDLLYYEGPLESHFVNEHDEDFIFKWSDQDRQFNRWMVYKTTTAGLVDYFNMRINSRDMILSNPDGWVYFIDMDNNLEYRHIQLVKTEDIPEDYLPTTRSFYKANAHDPYAHQLHAYLDYHFSRQQKLYRQPAEPALALVAEPAPGYGGQISES
ncbi:MAG: hypothetical protein ACKVUS_10440 [Saprospiraceae bacterium]